MDPWQSAEAEEQVAAGETPAPPNRVPLISPELELIVEPEDEATDAEADQALLAR